MPGGAIAGGLTGEEAARRLRREGPNELPRQNRRALVRIALDVMHEPMLALLLAGGVIYLALGDRTEAIVLIVLAAFSIAITLVQEARSEHAIEALRDIASPRALVLRDGIRQRIAGREVTRGDLMILAEGDRVAADAWVLANDGLQLDESLLTGECLPVAKVARTPSAFTALPRPGGDGLAYVFSGSLVVAGSGMCEVAATGERSEIGRIGQSLSTLETQAPHLHRQTRRLVLVFALLGASVSVAMFLLYGALRGSWLDAALAAIALGMSMLPEEFPVVLAVFMAMGAMRMSRVRVLARRAAAIETLGSVTVLCTDKTGTLTENRMSVVQLRLPDGRVLDHDGVGALPDAFWQLAELGMLASAPQPFDPMEIAFHDVGRGSEQADASLRRRSGWSLRHHYPLAPELLAVSQIWHVGGGDEHVIATKGAPETIAELCGLDLTERSALAAMVDEMARGGLRVLGVAEAHWRGATFPESQRAFTYSFRGLVGLQDPLRGSVPAAVRECRSAGIRVVMITGDYPETARAIAHQAGIETGEVVTGAQLAEMDDDELRRCAGVMTIFARIMPEQKLRIVRALQATGEIVGMTGDGVNDAPSLKAADIGIAMGSRGTDVAREAASIVLLDDDFGSIVTSIRVGRRIFDNLRKAMGFIVAVHLPIAGLALMPLLFGLPILLAPVHIALLEMIIDPVCSLVFEAEREEDDVMRRPPRPPGGPLFPRALLLWSGVQGAVALTAIGTVLLWSLDGGVPETQLRTAVLFALITVILSLVLVNRSFSASIVEAMRRRNTLLAVVAALVALLCAAAEFLTPVSGLLRLAPVGAEQVGAAVLSGAAVLGLLEALKSRRSKRAEGSTVF